MTDDTAPSSIVAARHPSAHADVHPVASNPLIMKQDSEGRSWWEHQVSKAFTDIGAPRPKVTDDTAPSSIVAARHPSAHTDVRPSYSNQAISENHHFHSGSAQVTFHRLRNSYRSEAAALLKAQERDDIWSLYFNERNQYS